MQFKVMNENTTTNVHKSVLLHEAIDALNIKSGDIFLDGTLGGGGHSKEVAQRHRGTVKIIGLDMDEEALRCAEEVLKPLTANYVLKQANFRNIDIVLDEMGITSVDKILLDLGLSSNQLELSGRGFSFQKDEPLIMTFATAPDEKSFSAREIVNNWEEEHIADVLFGYGEESFSRKIAKTICEERRKKSIETTFQLVEVIKKATPFWYHHRKTHFATKTFQALRIAVNDEIRALDDGVRKGFERLKKGGRMAVISFHSTEDRLVKRFFRELQKDEKANISKKPIVPKAEEISKNPRARSAKLRIVEKI